MYNRQFTVVLSLFGSIMIALAFLTALLFTASGPAASQVFVTNTPRPGADEMMALPDETPDAPLEQYALRLWTENDLIDVLADQLTRLNAGRGDEATIRLLQYELQRRFPGAPRQPAQRERLLNLMLAAPVGSVDMRSVVPAHIVDELNARGDQISRVLENTLVIDNFLVRTSPLDLDGDDDLDALLYIRYPANDTNTEIRYDGFNLARTDANGDFILVEASPDFPVAPLREIQSLSPVRLGDLTLDGRDEVAISINHDGVNSELRIYGWRGGEAINLVQPGQTIIFGEIISWPLGDSTLSVAQYRVESERWQCVSALNVTWEWSANFYRPIIADNAVYQNLNTVGCALYEAEPIFASGPERGIQIVSDILANGSPEDVGYTRGALALAMLYQLNEQTRSAAEQIEQLRPLADDDPWLAGQIEAFTTSAESDTFAPVQVCAALLAADEFGACDIDGVLTYIFENNPLLRENDLIEQLEARNLPILETTIIAEVGRANRQAVNFALTGSSWWAFAPTGEIFYVPGPIDPPAGFAPASLPDAPAEAPEAAFTALFAGNLNTALTAIDNAARDTSAGLAPSARYMKALLYDLLGDRQNARRAYYELWSNLGASTWGQLAAAHLERR